ncbi:4-hydroxythreonine-4-phosphate dehydrogenase PdxA [Labrenzia sp. 011]|uniref:4-hydroxythreonine-4-phosphate dehydrogenase PdxA n=1 Tax=Labrenzia sp. 011 TaxID=2171494 RepID=UPI000D5138D6|nr:4-hydroxythreonine-4-phosphate dehydrogenase PdxA [Labrenzia sp. 011]PVB63394.1 4-hydroxythreonine-4-phosphate dehydrogenase PdxA [Labrenzia sp. 011]
MGTRKQPIAVTMGEPAGIGPDLVLLAWANRKALQLPPFYVRGDEALLASRAKTIDLNIRIESVSPDQASTHFPKSLPIVQTGPALSDRPGVEQAETAPSVVASIEGCVEDIRNGLASAVVTNPINKAALYRTGFTYPGHTEFLGALAEKHWPGAPATPVMMIAGPELMVVPVTIHIAIKDVPAALNEDLIVETAKITANDLRTRFGYTNPRLALCGLNPHAGEGGTMGTEDRDVIAPAVARLKAEGIAATGPHSADTLFHPQARNTYDCVLGMYHDQVLIPAKTIGFDEGVNVTLGLPFVRTSPDHGTAYDLAGSGTARIDSFSSAVRMADALAHPDQV